MRCSFFFHHLGQRIFLHGATLRLWGHSVRTSSGSSQNRIKATTYAYDFSHESSVKIRVYIFSRLTFPFLFVITLPPGFLPTNMSTPLLLSAITAEVTVLECGDYLVNLDNFGGNFINQQTFEEPPILTQVS